MKSTEEHTGGASEPGEDEKPPLAKILNLYGANILQLLPLVRWKAVRNSPAARRVAGASAWSIGGYGVMTVLRFVSRLVLAKLLTDASPMGDIATIVVILAGLEMISDLGIGFNIVQQKRGDDPRYLGTAFSVQAARSIVVWMIASALAQPVAWIYHDQELAGLLLFGAVATLLKGFANPGVWVLTRRAELRGPTMLLISSEVVGFLVTIVWALLDPSAWAVVGGTVSAAAAYSGFSHLLGNRTRFVWDGRAAREIIQFGSWMILSSATYFLSSRGESLMLRGSIPEVQFGTFAFAAMLVSTPAAAITQLGSQVFFPMLSAAIREDAEKGARLFRRGKWAFTAVALVFAWGGIFLGPPLLGLLGLGKGFVGLSWMVQLLAVRASMDIYASPSGSLLFASGASRYSAFANVVRLVILVAGLFLTTSRWGLTGAFYVLLGAPAISYLALLPGLQKHMPRALRIEIGAGLVLVAGIIAAAAIAFGQ